MCGAGPIWCSQHQLVLTRLGRWPRRPQAVEGARTKSGPRFGRIPIPTLDFRCSVCPNAFLTSACSDYEFVVPLYRLFRWMFDSIPIRADRRLGYAVVRGAGEGQRECLDHRLLKDCMHAFGMRLAGLDQ